MQIDASIHDWLEGRGEQLVLISMIDDATSRILARFYPGGTVETHMELVGRWLQRHGRPLDVHLATGANIRCTGKGRSHPFTTLKMAVLTPIPSASVSMATTVNPGLFSNCRILYSTS